MGVQIVGLGHALLCPLCPSDISPQGWGKGLRFAKGAFFLRLWVGYEPPAKGQPQGLPLRVPLLLRKKGRSTSPVSSGWTFRPVKRPPSRE